MQAHRKILFLPRWYPNKYAVQNGVFIQKHAKAAAVNNAVVVLLAAPSPDNSQIIKSQQGNLTEIFVYYKTTSLRWLNFVRYLVSLFKGWRWVNREGFSPDLCHVNMLNRPAVLALWLNWRYGTPFMLSEHWSGYITGQFKNQSGFKKWFSRFVARKASMITAVSEPLKKAMISCGLNGNIRLLPNVAEVLGDARQSGPVSGKFRFLAVADLNDGIKNVSGVIRAFTEIRRKQPDLELVIVGDGKDRNKLESLARESNGGISFMGEKSNEEVLRIIPTAHALVVNSRIETFSVVTLEAIFSGRPVIATRCGGPEQFINYQNGILIEKDNDRQLAEAMISMKNNYARYAPEKVKNSVADKFDVNSVGAVLDEFYDEVISNPSFLILNS